MVETIPPLLGAGTRFIAVGLILLPILAWRRGARVWRPTRAELLVRRLRRADAARRQRRHLRRRADRPVRPGRAAGRLDPAVGDPAAARRPASGSPARRSAPCSSASAGSSLLLHPSGRRDDLGLLACVGAALMWAIGSFASPRISLPRDPLVSTAWQSLLGGLVVFACGLDRRRARRRPLRRVLRPLDLRPALPDHLRLAARLHVLRLAAPERADLEGLHVRVREPGRRDRARLADPRRASR